MSNSSLITYKKISPNRTSPRNHVIDTITIHCMAGNLTLKSCGNIFSDKTRQSSANYGIDSNGKIAMYVEEKDRSWASSNSANDNRAVTIEVANDGGASTGWHVSNKAMESLIKLCADICKRNNIKELKWKADKTLIGKVDQQNMTVHRWFANKACPGDYLYKKHSYIANEVNKILSSSTTSTSKKSYVYGGLDYSLVFDPVYYAEKYSDVKAAFGNDANKLFSHFISNGMKEGRQGSANFNVVVYKSLWKDLQSAFGNDLPKYYQHYITNGYSEKRQCV